jgi:hypothetical protein
METDSSDRNGAGADDDADDAESDLKKSRLDSLPCGKPLTRTPLMTLVGHKEGVSGVTWLDQVPYDLRVKPGSHDQAKTDPFFASVRFFLTDR